MLSNYTDIELVHALCDGDTAAFKELHRRHAATLLRLSLAKTGSLPDAEDCVQEVFCNFWQHCINPTTAFTEINVEAYLVTAVKNYCFRFYRKQLQAKFIKMLVTDMTAEEENTTEQYLSRQELLKLLQEELDQMPEQMKRVFELSRQNGLSIREIALQLTLSEQTVKNHISRALQRLRLRLNHQLPAIFF